MTVRRVLVVEDEAVAAATMRRVLARAGHEVRTAATCAEALTAVTTWQPDLVFLDRQLPDGDGLEVAAALKHVHGVARVVLLTGDVFAPDHDAVDAVLVKPIGVRTLLAAADPASPPAQAGE